MQGNRLTTMADWALVPTPIVRPTGNIIAKYGMPAISGEATVDSRPLGLRV